MVFAVAWLPQASVFDHVKVRVKSFTHAPGALASALVAVTIPVAPQLSLKDTVGIVNPSSWLLHWNGPGLLGSSPIVGAVVSWTMTAMVFAVAWLPQVSVFDHV
jgi:hypothetical protein